MSDIISSDPAQKNDIWYKYKTVSVDHLDQLQEDFDRHDRAGSLSDHPTFRSYLANKKFTLPEDMPNAKSIIVMAVFNPLMLVDFHVNGKPLEVMLPPQYYDDGVSLEDLEAMIQEDILPEPGYEILCATHLHLKLLAVRSGLGRYGRNNICYVDDMGSLLTLYAYFTDYEFEVYDWADIGMMPSCENCQLCYKRCPTQAIRKENFVVDIGRCVTLYNEIHGEFPDWMPKHTHNALMGCMHCQLNCPANREPLKRSGRLEAVTQEETDRILRGDADEALLEALSRKLRSYYPASSAENFPIFTRNLGALLLR
ncbi:MAG: hypothetical protein GTO14_05655 [Anaerolineales bacterium]|nr:hypothetical protein [Anaerolineales bacterium]